MTKTKHFLLLLIVALAGVNVKAQANLKLPSGEELKTADDCARYEPLMVEAAKWLEETDLDKNIDQRKEINFFVIQWVSLSSTVTVELNEQLHSIYNKNVHLLGIYLASCARYYIENKGTATKFVAIKTGLTSMMNVYKKGIDISKSKEMEKLIKMDETKLDEYINSKLM